ncbi:MAG TPA: PH domain-containing protein, partial [Pseudonocardiaceae bacterium]
MSWWWSPVPYRDDGETVVLRRTAETAFALVAFVAVLASLPWLLWQVRDLYPAWDMAQFIAGMSLLLWFIWLAGPHVRIVVSPRGVTVVDWVTRHEVPWSALEDVRAERDLRLVLRGGRHLLPAAGGRSLLPSPIQSRLRARILAARPHGSGGSGSGGADTATPPLGLQAMPPADGSPGDPASTPP